MSRAPKDRPLAAKIVDLDVVNQFVRQYHRHHKPVLRAKMTIGAPLRSDGALVGVACVGRPVARREDDGETLEVTRLATDGTPNAASFLLARCRVFAFRVQGARKLLTYTLPDESGASLRAAGYRFVGEAGGGVWTRPSRFRRDSHPTQTKLKWEATS
jgi:hypothetical protein